MFTNILWLDITILSVGALWVIFVLWDLRPEHFEDRIEEE